MTVSVRLYAGIKERAGVGELTVEAGTVEALRKAVAAACPGIAEQLPFCRIALDDEFVDDDAAVRDGAIVDVIPPVSGG